MANPNFLIVAFAGQSHINPAFQLAGRLLRTGASVTFTTTTTAHRSMSRIQASDRLTFATYSDGAEEGPKPSNFSLEQHMEDSARRCSEAVRQIIEASRDKGENFTCIFYTAVASWVGEVARCYDIPSGVLWIQPATLFEIYYYYINGYGDSITNESNDPSSPTQLPGLPPLTGRDVPTFLTPGSPFRFLFTLIEKEIQSLKGDRKARLLVNTFDALESEQLNAIDELKMVAVGRYCLPWRDEALLAHRRSDLFLAPAGPFLWVIKKALIMDGGDGDGKQEESEDQLSCMEELQKQGMIVPWCSQVEVLSHPSVGCFVTHCGWNSTLESVVCGVPMVAFPLWADQLTNAMLIQDVWKVGVRVSGNERGVVEGEELTRCLEMVLGGGERSEGMRGNAKRLKDAAREASKEGGCADKNLKALLEELVSG
ncbi:hypothetical protein EUGRSUZ_H00007 [Eucalyptus grandis]|uniref:Uncharacterized protein n=2 Tax=Eucalyptus grandis TaxID=71139 RepID=A0ACC3JLV8_EUCGR|nr:hypothetical protein EUGRSUZ_H00007 [Eucalyptus grandis]